MELKSIYMRVFLLVFLVTAIASIFIIGVSIGRGSIGKEKPNLVSLESVEEKHIVNKIVAVDSFGKGASADLITEIRPGTGLVLVNINDVLADFNTQYSARVAALVAKNYTQVDLSNVDIIFNIKTNANVIGGQSAGSTMTIAVIAGLLNKTLQPGVIMTGSIREDGRIGDAGAIKEKARAAKEANATLFLVPVGSGSEIKAYKREKKCGSYNDYEYCEISYVEDKRNIGDNLEIKVVEISTIEEAVEYFFADEKKT